MRNQVGFVLMFVMALVSAARVAPAGCPLMRVSNATCDSDASSIQTCVNAIWRNFNGVSALSRSLRKYPDNVTDRMSLINQTKEALPVEIRLLGGAIDYYFHDVSPACASTWNGIESCKSDLRAARHGLTLLMKRELVAALSAVTRERLRQSLMAHEAEAGAQLDRIARSGEGDPSQLCDETYASLAGCRRAVAADQAALRTQVFQVYSWWCGVPVPQLITSKDVVEEPTQRVEGAIVIHTLGKMTVQEASRMYAWRLQRETGTLEKLNRIR